MGIRKKEAFVYLIATKPREFVAYGSPFLLNIGHFYGLQLRNSNTDVNTDVRGFWHVFILKIELKNVPPRPICFPPDICCCSYLRSGGYLRRVRKRSLKLREMQEVEEYNEMQEAQDAEKRERDAQDKRQQEAQAKAPAAKRRSESLEDAEARQQEAQAKAAILLSWLSHQAPDRNWGERERAPLRRLCCKFSFYIYIYIYILYIYISYVVP